MIHTSKQLKDKVRNCKIITTDNRRYEINH